MNDHSPKLHKSPQPIFRTVLSSWGFLGRNLAVVAPLTIALVSPYILIENSQEYVSHEGQFYSEMLSSAHIIALTVLSYILALSFWVAYLLFDSNLNHAYKKLISLSKKLKCFLIAALIFYMPKIAAVILFIIFSLLDYLISVQTGENISDVIDSTYQITNYSLYFICTVISFRLMFFFPRTISKDDPSLKKAWHAQRGLTLKLICCFLLSQIPAILIALIAPLTDLIRHQLYTQNSNILAYSDSSLDLMLNEYAPVTWVSNILIALGYLVFARCIVIYYNWSQDQST